MFLLTAPAVLCGVWRLYTPTHASSHARITAYPEEIAFVRGGDTERRQVDGCYERLARHEYPRQVEFTNSLPKTPAGKVNRKALREREAKRMEDTA